MLKATAALPANHGKGKPFAQLVLTSDQRRLRRKVLSVNGDEVLVDFPEAVTLEHFGGLLLEDGRVVEIVAAPEPLLEINAAAAASTWCRSPGTSATATCGADREEAHPHPARPRGQGHAAGTGRRGQRCHRAVLARCRAPITRRTEMTDTSRAAAPADLAVAGLPGRRLRLVGRDSRRRLPIGA